MLTLTWQFHSCQYDCRRCKAGSRTMQRCAPSKTSTRHCARHANVLVLTNIQTQDEWSKTTMGRVHNCLPIENVICWSYRPALVHVHAKERETKSQHSSTLTRKAVCAVGRQRTEALCLTYSTLGVRRGNAYGRVGGQRKGYPSYSSIEVRSAFIGRAQ